MICLAPSAFISVDELRRLQLCQAPEPWPRLPRGAYPMVPVLIAGGASMNDFIILVFGLLMPLLVSGLKQESWPDWAKVLTSLLLSLVGGAITAAVNGEFALDRVAGSAGVIFTASTVFYKTYFQDTTFNKRLERKEM